MAELYHLWVVATGESKGQPFRKVKCGLSNPSVSWLRGKMRERAAAMLRLCQERSAQSVRSDLDDDQILVEGGGLSFLFYTSRCSRDDRACEGECDATVAG